MTSVVLGVGVAFELLGIGMASGVLVTSMFSHRVGCLCRRSGPAYDNGRWAVAESWVMSEDYWRSAGRVLFWVLA